MKTTYNRRVTIDGITYDSKLEHRLLKETSLTEEQYHCTTIDYTIHSEHTYHPDFTVIFLKQLAYLKCTTHFEAKGRFNFRQDMIKYKHIKRSLEKQGHELVFIFENPKTKTPGAKARKDGTYLTNAEWATKEGFRWVTAGNVDNFLKQVYTNLLTSRNYEFYLGKYLIHCINNFQGKHIINIFNKPESLELYHGRTEIFIAKYCTIENFIAWKEKTNS